MGEAVTLTAKDGLEFSAWREAPREARRGGLVVCHAIWGVTPHLRALASDWAEDGYEVLVPNLFARQGQGFADKDTDPALLDAQMAKGEATGWGAGVMSEVQAAIEALQPPVFVMGFCYGGTVAWLAACRCEGVAAAACFYGGQIALFRDETPRCPTILHFGKRDPLIPPGDVEAIAAAHPEIPAYLYDAGHGFVGPSGFHADSARLARLRTLQLFARHGGRGEA